MNKIVSLPFFHGTCNNQNNDGFPNVLPIEIYYDLKLKMFRCEKSELLEETLNQVYLKGSLVDGSISSESGGIYVSRLVEFIIRHASIKKSSRILEIGFGKGTILKKLKQLEYSNLLGVEPGDHQFLSEMNGIEMINDFFPTNQISGNFDVIYHFAVWEHVDDPVVFIQDQLSFLKEDGCLIFGVPNCEPYYLDGDVSMFIHEHFSYFTSESIAITVEIAGGKLEYIEIIEGMLVGKITKAKKNHTNKKLDDLAFDDKQFWGKSDKILEALKALFFEYENQNEIVIYVPGRALNALYMLGLKNVRFVDDNSEMRNRYLPYFDCPVESFEQMCENPPKIILIYSITFGEKIREKCKGVEQLSETRIITINNLYD